MDAGWLPKNWDPLSPLNVESLQAELELQVPHFISVENRSCLYFNSLIYKSSALHFAFKMLKDVKYITFPKLV